MEFIRVGWLGRTRGVTGDIWVTPDTDFPERFLNLDEVFVRDRDRWDLLAIDAADLIGGRPVLRFRGITSLEEARRLTNRELAVKRHQVVELPGDSHYIFDLIGCSVFDRAGTLVGELVDVETYPANDMYVIRTPQGTMKHLPAARPFVADIDIAGKRIVIDRAGLFEATSASQNDAEHEV
jgi:16S rRNA processing protein RimM